MTTFLEDVDAMSKRVGQLHLATLAPELTVISLVGEVVQHDEVADAFDLTSRVFIVSCG